MTCWLAYNLFFKLKDFCVVCVSMYVANFALIPMMYGICKMDALSMGDFEPFFGLVPPQLLYPFLALDAAMFAGVLALYFSSPAHARELEVPEGAAGEAGAAASGTAPYYL